MQTKSSSVSSSSATAGRSRSGWLDQVHRHARVLGAELGQHRGQQVCGDARQHPHRHAAVAEADDVRHALAAPLQLGEHTFGVLEERLPR
jgi:hypothetical protein